MLLPGKNEPVNLLQPIPMLMSADRYVDNTGNLCYNKKAIEFSWCKEFFMKRIFLFTLTLLLVLPLTACGELKPASFAPQTPREFFDVVMGDFRDCTAYRLRTELFPDQEDKGEITDLYVSKTESGLTLSGEKTYKVTGLTSFLYGEGDLLGEGPWIRRSNQVTYRKKQEGTRLSLPDVSIGDGALLEHLLNGFLQDYLSAAELTAKEDGSYVLSIHLKKEETFLLYNIKPEIFYSFPSDVVYTADGEGRLTSVTFSRQSRNTEDLRVEVSYEAETHTKPRWYNAEKPFESDAASLVEVIYELGEGRTVTLSQTDEGWVVEAYVDRDGGNPVITVPDFIPTDAIYDLWENGSLKYLIIPQWSPEIKFAHGIVNMDVFFEKGPRPEGDLDEHLYFEGEWELVDGVPKITKRH